MKQTFTFLAALLFSVAFSYAQTLPIYMDEVITEAPEGTVVSGCQRSGFSYFYSSGYFQGGYNEGFVGEYVLGNDGCIYLKQPCASLEYVSYLKLDKVTDESNENYGDYVCHTAQCAYVYDGGTAIYTYFATRLVYTKYSETSYGYALEKGPDGLYVTDVYFTFQDGVLQQKNQQTIDMNGEKLPYELIGLTNQSGGWVGYGDACITIRPASMQPATLPQGAEVKQGSFAYNMRSSSIGQNVRNAQLCQYAEVGDDYYLLSPLDGKNWIHGTIDRAASTVTFTAQYVGINENIGCHEWFIPATYNDWFEEWDPEDHTGEWMRDYTAADSYVCKYDNGNLISDDSRKQVLLFSLSENAIQTSGVYADFSVQPYTGQLTKPAQPRVLRFSPVEETFFWGELVFAVPPVDVNDAYIDTENLYYNIYLGDAEKPYVFKRSDYGKIPASEMTDIPFLYDDDSEFDHNAGPFHNLFFYQEGVKFVGVQSIHRKDGQEVRSEIGWYGYTPSGDGLTRVVAPGKGKTAKRLQNGRIIITHDDHKYNLQGQSLQ